MTALCHKIKCSVSFNSYYYILSAEANKMAIRSMTHPIILIQGSHYFLIVHF